MSKDIKNIIFDLGGVILNIDPNLTNAAFAKLGLPAVFDRYKSLPENNYFDMLERGTISPVEFLEHFKLDFSCSIDMPTFEAAWNALLLDLPPHRLDFLAEARSRYRTFLLSNTNEVHVEAFHGYVNRNFGISDLSQYFERVYYSCRMAARKPERRIYAKVLEDAGLNAAETLFIDDSEANLRGAELEGIQVLHLAPGMELSRDLLFLIAKSDR